MSQHEPHDHHPRGPVDVAVVGAGIVGCAVAREAARAGARVVLFEREGAPSSPFDLGAVSAQCDVETPDAFFELRARGREAFAEFVSGIEEDAGVRIPLRSAGTLAPASTLVELEALHGRATWQRRRTLAFESLTGGTTRDREPGLMDGLVAGLHLPLDVGVDAAALHTALLHAAVEAGVELHLGVPVLGVAREGGRIAGLHIPEGTVAAGAFIVCAGAYSGVGGLPSAPVTPRRAPVAWLGQSHALKHGLWHPNVRIAPLPDGRVLLSGPPEDVGFDTRLPASRLGALLSQATTLVPGLAGLPVQSVGTRLFAGTPDGQPLLGSTDAVSLIYATGFGEHAVVVAPAVAALLVEYLQTGRTTGSELSAFSPLRFAT